jgi:peptide/nickel transport system substrate-binding protein
MMLSRKAVEAGGEDFTRKAFKAGTGAFVLTEAVKDDHTTLEKNPDWWGKDSAGSKLPFVDKVIIRPVTNSDVRLTSVRTGDAQMLNNIAPKDVVTVKNDSSLVYQEKPGYDWGSLIPNRKEGFVFNEVRYVKALAMAIDRKEFLDKAFFGIGTIGYGTISPLHFAYDPNFSHTRNRCRRRQETGPGRRQGPAFLRVLVRRRSDALQQAQLLQAQLRKADIDADRAASSSPRFSICRPSIEFKGITSSAGADASIHPNTYDHLVTGKPFNDSSYSNKDVDKYLEDQRATSDEAKRKDALRKAEQIYVVDDPGASGFVSASRPPDGQGADRHGGVPDAFRASRPRNCKSNLLRHRGAQHEYWR